MTYKITPVVFSACLIASQASTATAETLFYLPGTGSVQNQLDFESTALLTADFNYNLGWAGSGFGLTGTQRGAPEVIGVNALPSQPAGAGAQGLAFNSQTRDAAWYNDHPEALNNNVYDDPDGEAQDDFFWYTGGWTPADTPSVMMHVWLPDSATYTSLRMTTKYQSGAGPTNSWPGIWLYTDRLTLRGPGRPDITYQNGMDNGDSWWTLGLSVTPNGDLQYYAVDEYVTELTADHHIGTNSELAAANGYTANYLVSQNDATLMTSNRNFAAADQTYFDDLTFTKDTTVFDNEVVGDIDGDGFVGLSDLDIILNNWNQTVTVGDHSQGDIAGIGDGFIGLSDLDVLLSNWNAGTPPTGAALPTVPEPAGLLIVMAGGAVLLKRSPIRHAMYF